MRQADQTVKTKTILQRVCIALIVLYRGTVGRFLGGQCRHFPSCSQYAIDAIEKYGALQGSWRGLKRICRCHPWGGSGFDPA
jgi:putative membrane protein insertion efficiency factor